MIYMIGVIVLIIALFVAGSTFHWPMMYVWIGAIVLLGIGILSGVSSTKRRDPSAEEKP